MPSRDKNTPPPIAQEDSIILLSGGTQNKRARSHTEEVESPQTKRAKTDNTNKDKRHRKKRKRKVPVVGRPSDASIDRAHSPAVMPLSPSKVNGEGAVEATSSKLGESSSAVLAQERLPSAGPSSNRLPSDSVTHTTIQGNPDVAEESPILARSSEPLANKENIIENRPSGSRDKGKGKATEGGALQTPLPNNPSRPVSPISTPHPPQSNESQLLSRHRDVLGSITQSLYCQICLDILFKPYALAPCGHVTCYDCLIRWFTALGEGEGEAGRPPQPAWRRKKTCPHCRCEVTERPGEVWVIKDMVNTLAKSGLVPGFEQPTVPVPNATGGASAPATEGPPAPVDPWEAIFRRPQRYGGDPDREDREMGVRDEEDDVWRCYDCMHEIFDGECTGCGRLYPAHVGMDDEDDDDDDWNGGFNALFEPVEGWMDFDDEAAEAEVLGNLDLDADDVDDYVEQYGRGALRHGIPHPDVDDDDVHRPWYAEYHEDDDDSDDGSDGPGFPPGRHRVPRAQPWAGGGYPALRRHPNRPYPQAHIEEVDEEGEGDSLGEEEGRSIGDIESQYGGSFIDDGGDSDGGNRPLPHHENDVVEVFGSDEDEEPYQPRIVGRHYRVYGARVDSDEDDEDVRIVEPVAMRYRGRGRPNAPIVLSSDSENGLEEEEDADVIIYQAHLDEDEDEDALSISDGSVGDYEDEDGSIRRPPMRLARSMGRRR